MGANLCVGAPPEKGHFRTYYAQTTNGVEPFIRLTLLTELSQIPVPLPSLTRRSLERFLELREGVNQESSATRQDRSRTRIADDRCVVGEDSK